MEHARLHGRYHAAVPVRRRFRCRFCDRPGTDYIGFLPYLYAKYNMPLFAYDAAYKSAKLMRFPVEMDEILLECFLYTPELNSVE